MSAGGLPTPPSDWIVRWVTLLLPPPSTVLDVACGSGRHVRWLARAGHAVTAIDRDGDLLAPLSGLAHVIQADLEAAPWPLPGATFDAVVVTHYLWRPLLPRLLESVAPGGLLLYETFTLAQAALGRPRNPDFLLRPGELPEVLRAADGGGTPWKVIAFEEGRLPSLGGRAPREIQRIAARRGQTSPPRHDLLAPEG